jgi:hypothetical protein
MGTWTGVIWLREGTGGGLVMNFFGLHKFREILVVQEMNPVYRLSVATCCLP